MDVQPDHTEDHALLPELKLEAFLASWLNEGTFKIDGDVTLIRGRYELTRLQITAVDGAHPGITTEVLRHLSVGDIVRNATVTDKALLERTRGFAWGVISLEDRDRMREAGPVTETLEAVSRIVTIATALRQPVNSTIQRIFNVSRPTADRWVAKARERGLLAESERSRAANRHE